MDDKMLQDLIDAFLKGNPRAAFNTVFNPLLGSNNRNFGSWLNNQADDMQNRYLGTIASNPTGNYYDWLKTQHPLDVFQSLAPRARGENPGLYSPSLKWAPGIFG